MALKTTVKVGNISNLSDARYCAGMGVDLLGFSVLPDTPNHVSPKLFQDIRGWISGPKVVAELNGVFTENDLREAIESYAPDYFQIEFEALKNFPKSIATPLIVKLGTESEPAEATAAYFVCDFSSIENLSGRIAPESILVQVEKADEADIVFEKYKAGVALLGTHEIRPGFKAYDDLSEVLERLEY